MTLPQKHEDRPVAPALSRGSRQAESHATPHGPDLEDMETATANLEIDRPGLDMRHDPFMGRSQGTIGLGTSAPSNPTSLELPGLQDATKTDITESVDPKTKGEATVRPSKMQRSPTTSASSERIQPATGPCLTPTLWEAWCPVGGLDSVSVLFTAVAASVTNLTGMPYGNCIIEPLTPPPSPPESSACSSIGDGLADDAQPHRLAAAAYSSTIRQNRQAGALREWQSWARREKFLKEAPHHLARQHEARRKSLLSPPEASSTTVAGNPDPPLPKYDAPDRKSLLSHPEAPPTIVVSIPDPPPKYVSPGTKSFRSPPEASPITAADPLLPKYAPPRVSGPVPAMGEVAAFASRPTSPSTSLPRDAVSPENIALGAPDTASMVGKIAALASRPSSPKLEDIPDPGDDQPSFAASPPDRLDAPPPRRHDYSTLPPLPASVPAAPDMSPSVLADVLPFRKTFSDAIEDLPAELNLHPSRTTIVSLLKFEPDYANQLMHRRSVYTEENFEQWAEWSPPSKAHPNEREYMRSLNKDTLLTAPNLRGTDKVALAEEWHTYRKRLLYHIQQALLAGGNWRSILNQLDIAFRDPDEGYPRLAEHIVLALRDAVLMKYPLLHADVLIYEIDGSYSQGIARFSAHSNSAVWDQTTMRMPGEDVVTLAKRVETAYLEKHHGSITRETLYAHPTKPGEIFPQRNIRDSDELQDRYRECLTNDEENPTRGDMLGMVFGAKWDTALLEYDKEKKRLEGLLADPVFTSSITPEVTSKLFPRMCDRPTIVDIAQQLLYEPVETHGTHDKDGWPLDVVSASSTFGPNLVKHLPNNEAGGVYRVPRRDEEPRTNSRDRRRNARQHLQLGYKPSKPSKPSSYHIEPHHYETPSE